MQAIMETIFDVVYLCTVITLGIRMVMGAGEKKQVKLFGIMAVTLGCGDAFHLVPRAYALCTDGLANHAASLGFGKFVTSVTMTIFYVILYHIWRQRYEVTDRKELTTAVYALAIVRIALCFMPGNDWLSANAPLSWGIYRNIPFAFLGLLMIVLSYQKAKETKDTAFRYMWLAITLSFGFYIPVVLWADAYPLVGTLMIPKTCAYVWMVWMGYHEWKKNR
ncbi:MAG: hypothetical protein KHZ58_15050 [Hungatella hathewayi]|nr:hypothetical protein [Hungatella hathewayi]